MKKTTEMAKVNALRERESVREPLGDEVGPARLVPLRVFTFVLK